MFLYLKYNSFSHTLDVETDSSFSVSRESVHMEQDSLLASVLAFVDEFDRVGERKHQIEGKEKELQSISSSSSASAGRKRRVEAKYTTNLQRRKRAELSDLREQATLLESRLKQLQHVTRPSEICRHESGENKKWVVGLEEEAASELAARLQVERENTKLRSRLERHKKFREKIGRLIDRYKREQGSIVDGKSLISARKSCAVAGMTTLIPTSYSVGCVTVAKALEQLVNQVDCVFASSSSRSQSCWLEVNEVGNTRQVLSSTLAECSVISAGDALWCKPKRIPPRMPAMTYMVCIDDGCYSFKRSLLPIQCRQWDDRREDNHSNVEVLLHVEHYSRRVYDQSTGQAVLVTLALIRLPSEDGGGVLLREHLWRRITPVNDSGDAKSISQTCYKIHPGEGSVGDLSRTQASVMSALVQITRRNHSAHQDRLLEVCR